MADLLEPLDVLWSLWGELGVPGTVHLHGNVAVDPEPLVVYAPFLVKGDARLREMALTWCAQHHGLLGSVRIRRLHRAAPEPVARAFEAFSAVVNTVAATRWPMAAEADVHLQADQLRPIAVPLRRPSLAWLRARAIQGAGARADLLCAMLANAEEHRAIDLEWVGYSRRAVDDVLSVWVGSGVVEAREVAGARSFTLRHRASWRSVLEAEGVRWLDVDALMRLLAARAVLEQVREASSIVRNVEARAVRDALQAPAARRRWSMPPVDGRDDAWEAMGTFVERTWRDLDARARVA